MAGERAQAQAFTAREDDGPEISLPLRLDTDGKRRRGDEDRPVHTLLLKEFISRDPLVPGKAQANRSRAAPRRCDEDPTSRTMAGAGSSRAPPHVREPSGAYTDEGP